MIVHTGGVKRLTSYIAVGALIFSILALVMSLGAVLALFDIARGEESNLTLEWIAVWLAMPVIMLAHSASIVAMVALLFRRGR
ncbi:MAG: hypothetical protein JSW03_00920 [Candidatus Eiseniibacteriota bacterium]|nr:MAG: hypothetical protein JSW03_00920 [Candidatus Eisenbacteria bacterium]